MPVEGRVTLNNKPVADATVLFSPTRGNGPGPFVGTTDSNGQFTLGPVGKPAGGAAVDEYLVMITTVTPDPNVRDGDEPKTSQKEVVPVAYRNGSERYRVPDGGTKEANFEMKKR